MVVDQLGVGFVFFFKHKTAYELRISDWSSDVCSSDLVDPSTDICRHDLVLPADGGRALLATEDGGLLKADRIEWRAADGRLYAIFGPVTAEHRRPIGLLAPLVGLHLPAEVLVVHQPPAGEGRQRIPVAGMVLPLCSSPDGLAPAAGRKPHYARLRSETRRDGKEG